MLLLSKNSHKMAIFACFFAVILAQSVLSEVIEKDSVMNVRISQSVPRHLCRRAIRNTQVNSYFYIICVIDIKKNYTA